MAKKNKAGQVVVWIILGLLMFALAGFGVTSFGGSVRAVGTVGNTDIDVEVYGRELQQELQALSRNTGQAVTLAQAQQFGLDRTVLARLVSRAALDNEAARLGLSVGDQTVSDQVTSIQAFQGSDGSFDRQAYAFSLENAGLSIAEFEDQVRADTSRNILQAAVVGGMEAPAEFTDTLFSWARERRDITWALLGEAELPAPVGEPTDAQIEAFHSENPALFTLPETRVVTYAWLTPSMILEDVEVDEAALRTLYDERISEFVRPERRLVERLVFGSESEAAAAREQIEGGETTFDDLVAGRGLTLADIDMGDVSQAELDAAGEGVFALEDTGIAGPLPSPLGPALFRVNAILSAVETSFEDARDELAAEFASDRARREIDAMLTDLDDLLAGGATLEELAADTAMEAGMIEFRDGVEDGIAAYDEFRTAALVANEGDFPELYDFEEGGTFAIRLDEIRPPELQPLSDVRHLVIPAWKEAETERLLIERAQDAILAIEGGAEMAGQDLPLRTERGILRESFVEDAPFQLVENVFLMSPGDLRVFAAPGGAALVRLDAILEPDPDDDEALGLLDAFTQQTAQGMAGDALEMFSRAVQSQAGISINQQAINAVHAQFP